MGILAKLARMFESRSSHAVIAPKARTFMDVAATIVNATPVSKHEGEVIELEGAYRGFRVTIVFHVFIGEVAFSTNVCDHGVHFGLHQIVGEATDGMQTVRVSDRFGYNRYPKDLPEHAALWNRIGGATRIAIADCLERDEGSLKIAGGKAELKGGTNVVFADSHEEIVHEYLDAIVGIARSLAD